MTRQEYANLISQLPKDTFRKYVEKYGFIAPFDFSPYKCIHTSEYDYYPDLQCVTINNKILTWDQSAIFVNPSNPQHLATIKDIIQQHKRKSLGLIRGNTPLHGLLGYCCESIDKPMDAIPFDNSWIYYNNKRTNLKDELDLQLIAKCIIAAIKYDVIVLYTPDNYTHDWTTSRNYKDTRIFQVKHPEIYQDIVKREHSQAWSNERPIDFHLENRKPVSIQEYAELIKQLPESLYKRYGFYDPFQYKKYKCIHTNKYDFYPEANLVIIDDIPIAWYDDSNYANPAIPSHYKRMKRIANNRHKPRIGIFHTTPCKRYKPTLSLYDATNEYTKEVIRKHALVSIEFDEGPIYYEPERIDLPNSPKMLLPAKCLFVGKKYNTQIIRPEPNVPPNEWMFEN